MVGLPELQRAPLLAKIDTGAWSNTLHAADIEIIESSPESKIRFRLRRKEAGSRGPSRSGGESGTREVMRP